MAKRNVIEDEEAEPAAVAEPEVDDAPGAVKIRASLDKHPTRVAIRKASLKIAGRSI